MDTVGVRELRQHVAALLRRAAAGEHITVTVGGRPLARLAPLEPTGGPTLDDLVATGLVDPPRHPAPPLPRPVDPPVDIRLDDVLDAIRGA